MRRELPSGFGSPGGCASRAVRRLCSLRNAISRETGFRRPCFLLLSDGRFNSIRSRSLQSFGGTSRRLFIAINFLAPALPLVPPIL